MELFRENEIRSPYNLREMLWYIIPGATLLLLIFLFEYWLAFQICGGVNYNKNEVPTVNENVIKDSVGTVGLIELRSLSELRSNSVKKLRVKVLDSLKDVQEMHKSLRENIHTPLLTALSFTHMGEKMFGENWVLSAVYLLLLLTICYIAGHVTYIIGTFFYERGLVSKGYSYPYLKMLGLPEHDTKNTLEIKASQSFYVGMYFWSAFLFILIYAIFVIWCHDSELFKYIALFLSVLGIVIPLRLKFILGRITDWKQDKKDATPRCKGFFYWFSYCIFLICLYLFFDLNIIILISYAFITIFLTEIVIRKWLAPSTCILEYFSKKLKNYLDTKDIAVLPKKESDKEKFSYEAFFICIYNYFGNERDKFLRNYFHTQTKFDIRFIEKYKSAFQKVFGIDYAALARHNYWLCKFFVMDNSTNLNQQINFWENIYRFTKSLSAAFYMAFIFCSVSFMFQYDKMIGILKYHHALDKYHYDITILFLISIIYYITTTLVIRYYIYVYDNRYCRMILRSFVSIVSSRDFILKNFGK